jgi:general secretion pathway protein H
MRALSTLTTDRRTTVAGFTLIEILLVMTLMGLLMALVLPAFARVMPGVELHKSVVQLASALRSARSTAVSRANEVCIEIDQDQGLYGIEGAEQRHKLAGQIRWMDSEFTKVSAGDDVRCVRFFPHGGSSGAAFALENSDRRYQIRVDWLTGAVRIDD